jgi:hypothetical protein
LRLSLLIELNREESWSQLESALCSKRVVAALLAIFFKRMPQSKAVSDLLHVGSYFAPGISRSQAHVGDFEDALSGRCRKRRAGRREGCHSRLLHISRFDSLEPFAF